MQKLVQNFTKYIGQFPSITNPDNHVLMLSDSWFDAIFFKDRVIFHKKCRGGHTKIAITLFKQTKPTDVYKHRANSESLEQYSASMRGILRYDDDSSRPAAGNDNVSMEDFTSKPPEGPAQLCMIVEPDQAVTYILKVPENQIGLDMLTKLPTDLVTTKDCEAMISITNKHFFEAYSDTSVIFYERADVNGKRISIQFNRSDLPRTQDTGGVVYGHCRGVVTIAECSEETLRSSL